MSKGIFAAAARESQMVVEQGAGGEAGTVNG
jgi:hypothetical protein